MSMCPPTVGDLVDFILINRSGAAFPDADGVNTVVELEKQIKNGTLCYHTNQMGMLDGVMFGEIREDSYYVQNILTVGDRHIAKTFMQWIVQNFGPKVKYITGNRHGKRMCKYEINKQNIKAILY